MIELATGFQAVQVDVGAHAHPHLATGGVDVGGLVRCLGHEDAEARGRLSEPVHLGLEGHDLVAGLAQRRGEALVVGGGGARVGARIGQAPFQHGDVVRVGGRALPHPLELLAQQGQRRLTVVGTVGRCHRTPPRRKTLPAITTRSGVILAIRAGCRTASPSRCDDPRGQPPGEDQEAGVADHRVLGPHGQPLGVPAADQRLRRLRLGEAGVDADGLHRPGQLGGGGHVARRAPRPAPAPPRPRRRSPRARACRGRSGRPPPAGPRPTARPGRRPAAPSPDGAGRGSSPRSPRRSRRSPSRRSYEISRPVGPIARSREMVRAPEPTPASITRAPGKTSAPPTIWAASLG